MNTLINYLLPMSFSAKLIQIRKSQGLTQTALSETSTLHINQIRRYEAGTSQPTMEGLIKLAKALHVSIDDLVFDEGDRGPSDKMKLMFEAINNLSDSEQNIIQELLEGMIVKYETRKWNSARQQAVN
jgi:transcriptional regulator with XRE-family HTH domain